MYDIEDFQSGAVASGGSSYVVEAESEVNVLMQNEAQNANLTKRRVHEKPYFAFMVREE